MKNNRKLILGLAFIGCATFLIWAGIREHSDLIGLSTVIASLAGGVLAVVWGNAKEHAAKASTPTE